MIVIVGPILLGLTYAAPSIAPQVIGAGVSLGLQGKPPQIRISPGDIARAAVAARDLRARGLQPQITEDPFTGDLVVATSDQPTYQLLQEKYLRQLGQPPPSVITELETLRQAAATAPIPPVATPTESTLAAMSIVGPAAIPATRRRLTSGVASQGNVLSKLSGPCAGRTTGLQRLRCALGGFA